MHVLDAEQAAHLLDLPLPSTSTGGAVRPLRFLDVGAGDGGVTAELAPLFGEVLATEASSHCVRAIRKRGIHCECTSDLSSLGDRRWDVVACLNVLDRCARPLDLMADLHRLAEPGHGRVLLALVLPYRPWVEDGGMGRRIDPEQRLPVWLVRPSASLSAC
jgi:2-polyprenyl-3-methyl-5-hydroxy-6-metoxy-1,4-benzoquinol methylase